MATTKTTSSKTTTSAPRSSYSASTANKQAAYNASNLAGIKAGTVTALKVDGINGSKTQAALSGGGSSSGGSSSSSSGGSDGVIKYNSNTGKLLAPGESFIDAATGRKLTQGTQYISASDLGQKAPVIPTAPVDTTDYSSILAGMTIPGGTTTDPKTGLVTVTGSPAVDASLTAGQSNFEKMLSSLQAPPSQAEAYKQAQQESGILEKQRVVGDLSAQLNSIQAQAQANQLSVVGQGRGIPEAIIGGQQAQIAKEAAIAALPVSAQLQAAQGNLEMAQQNLDTLFKIKSADMTAQYEYKNNLVKSVYDFATTQEKTKLDYALKKEDRAYNEKLTAQEDIKALASMALKNGAPASVLKNITSATSYSSALTAAAKYGQDPLDRALKQLALKKAQGSGTTEAPTIKTINGVDYQWDGASGKWVLPTGASSTGSSSATAQVLQDKMNNIDSVLKNVNGLKSAVGTNVFARDKIDLTGKKQNFIAGVQQIVSQDTIQTLINLKKQGGTLGALSDQERVLLQSAATKIGQWANTNNKGKVTGYSANEKDFKAELDTIKKLTERAYHEANGTTDNYLESVDAALQTATNPYSQYITD